MTFVFIYVILLDHMNAFTGVISYIDFWIGLLCDGFVGLRGDSSLVGES